MFIPSLPICLFLFWNSFLYNAPVATAVFASAGLVGESPIKLGFYTAKKAIPIYIIPFLFVLNPELLMLGGNIGNILFEFCMSVLTIIALCGSIEGVGKISLPRWNEYCCLLLPSVNCILQL